MTSLSDYPIVRRWPATHPDRLQLYSLPTANGQKVTIALEETGLPYEAHGVQFSKNEQKSAEFLSLNPNGKIPAIIDPNGPDGAPIALFESGAILIYLADKTGQLMPTDPGRRYETLQWLMWQMGGLGPMFGQLGHFHKMAADKVTDPYPKQRYLDESKRLLGVLDGRLADRPFIMGDQFTIADIAIGPWIGTLLGFYDAGDLVEIERLGNVSRYHEAFQARPAVRRGRLIPKRR